jgi:hypothetical protein
MAAGVALQWEFLNNQRKAPAMKSISFTVRELPEGGEYLEVRLLHKFGDHTHIEVQTNLLPGMPKGKTLLQVQAELWQAVAGHATSLADTYRRAEETQTIPKN